MPPIITGIVMTASVACTNANYLHSERCQEPPAYFIEHDNGEFSGQLTNGIMFTQTNVTNELGIRLQRFDLEEMFYYITDRGIIYADNDIQALSMYLSL